MGPERIEASGALKGIREYVAVYEAFILFSGTTQTCASIVSKSYYALQN